MDPVTGGLLLGGLAVSGAGLGYSIFGGSKPSAPDISGELARIRQLYALAREAAVKDINAQAAAGRTQQVSNLAARGTYRSPVAQNVFSALEAARMQSIGRAEGELYGAEAGATQGALGQLLGLTAGYQQMEQQRRAGIGGAMGSFGGALMGAGLSMYNQPQQRAPIGYGVISSPYGGGQTASPGAGRPFFDPVSGSTMMGGGSPLPDPYRAPYRPPYQPWFPETPTRYR